MLDNANIKMVETYTSLINKAMKKGEKTHAANIAMLLVNFIDSIQE